MPMIIASIDKIAREKQRDVLYIYFDVFGDHFDNVDDLFPNLDFRKWKIRDEIITWLESENITYQLCSQGYAASYLGQLYIDVPYDVQHPQFQTISQYLEDEHEQPKIPGILLCYFPLETAQKYAYQDDPNYDHFADDE